MFGKRGNEGGSFQRPQYSPEMPAREESYSDVAVIDAADGTASWHGYLEVGWLHFLRVRASAPTATHDNCYGGTIIFDVVGPGPQPDPFEGSGATVGQILLMSKEQLVLRMLCSDARVDSHRLRTGNLQEKDWARLAKAYADLSAARIFIDDSATASWNAVESRCRS